MDQEGFLKDEVLRAAMAISRGLGYRAGDEDSCGKRRSAA
jgi:hypothetical protein